SDPVARFLANEPEPTVKSRPVAAAEMSIPERASSASYAGSLAAGEGQDQERRELLVQHLEAIAGAHEELKKASEEDILDGEVFLGGLFWGGMLGCAAYFIAKGSSSSSNLDSRGIVVAGLTAVASFVAVYFWCANEKTKKTTSCKEKLDGLIRKAADT